MKLASYITFALVLAIIGYQLWTAGAYGLILNVPLIVILCIAGLIFAHKARRPAP
jgi:uncharacterized membrane protein